MIRTLIFVTFVIFCAPVFAQQCDLKTTSGELVSGLIEQTDAESIVINTGEPVTFEYEDISVLNFPGGKKVIEPADFLLQLVCGSRIHGSAFTSTSGESAFVLSSGSTILIPNRDIFFVQLKPLNTSPSVESAWTTIRETPLASGDAIVVDRGEGPDSIEGVIGDVTDERLQFRLDDQNADINRERISALIYYHAAGREFSGSLCNAVLSDGSSLNCRKLGLDQDALLIELVCGTSIRIHPDEITRIDFASGRTVLLSDLKPTALDWKPLIASEKLIKQLKTLNLPRINRSFQGGNLTLEFADPDESGRDVRNFDDGFAIKAGSRMVFNLDKKFRQLDGLAGFDPETISGGNVTLRIRANDRTLFEQHLTKSELTNPAEISLSVADIDRIVFEVEYHDGLEIGDTLHLCELRVTR